MIADFSKVRRSGIIFKERDCFASVNGSFISIQAKKKPFRDAHYEVLVSIPSIDPAGKERAGDGRKVDHFDHFKAAGSFRELCKAIARPEGSFKSFEGEIPQASLEQRIRKIRTDLESLLRQVAQTLGERI